MDPSTSTEPAPPVQPNPIMTGQQQQPMAAGQVMVPMAAPSQPVQFVAGQQGGMVMMPQYQQVNETHTPSLCHHLMIRLGPREYCC